MQSFSNAGNSREASVLAAKRKRGRSELEICRSEPTNLEVHTVRVEGKMKHLVLVTKNYYTRFRLQLTELIHQIDSNVAEAYGDTRYLFGLSIGRLERLQAKHLCSPASWPEF